MKNERQAYFELVRDDRQFRGSLGARRAAHPRPSLIRRLVARFL